MCAMGRKISLPREQAGAGAGGGGPSCSGLGSVGLRALSSVPQVSVATACEPRVGIRVQSSSLLSRE